MAALMKLATAAEELGYSSVQSIRNLEKRGELRIVHLPPGGGTKRAKGPARVPAEDVAKLKQRAILADGAPIDVPKPRKVTKPAHQRASMHFE